MASRNENEAIFCVTRLPETQMRKCGDSHAIVAYGKRRIYFIACNEVIQMLFPLGFEL